MRINHNLQSLNAYRQLSSNSAAGAKSLEKLSSGLRINRAGDDAAGLAISEKMRGQIRGLDQASRNAQDGISLIQTAEGALNETQSILQRMRELAVQSSNDTNVAVDRDAIQNEINQLVSEIDRIGNTTEFNTKTLLNGGAGITTSFSFETVGNATSDWISVLGGTADTALNNMNKAASLTDAVAATAAYTSFTMGSASASATKSFTLNGYTVNFAAVQTPATDDDTVIAAINLISDKTGVVASTGADTHVYLYTSAKGSGAKIELNAAASILSTATINAVTYQNGTDASISLNYGGAAIADTDYVASGDNITFTAGTLKGLELKLNGGVMSATANSNNAEFNITGNGTLAFQIGANQSQKMDVSINDMRATALGVNNLDVTSASTAGTSITTINSAITTVSTERAKLGAYQNRLEHTINNLGTASENLTASESRVRDVDMAKEMMEFTKNNILNQAATAMLAQANQAPQGVLQLLR